jgi:hypothetical protein
MKNPIPRPVKLVIKNEMESQNIIVAMKAERRAATQEMAFLRLSFCMYWTKVIEMCSLPFVVSMAAKRLDTRKRRTIKCRENGMKMLKSLRTISATGTRAIKTRAV